MKELYELAAKCGYLDVVIIIDKMIDTKYPLYTVTMKNKAQREEQIYHGNHSLRAAIRGSINSLKNMYRIGEVN